MADEKNTIDPVLEALAKLRDVCTSGGVQITRVTKADVLDHAREGGTGTTLQVEVFVPLAKSQPA